MRENGLLSLSDLREYFVCWWYVAHSFFAQALLSSTDVTTNVRYIQEIREDVQNAYHSGDLDGSTSIQSEDSCVVTWVVDNGL
jgi:hypothetical protein